MLETDPLTFFEDSRYYKDVGFAFHVLNQVGLGFSAHPLLPARVPRRLLGPIECFSWRRVAQQRVQPDTNHLALQTLSTGSGAGITQAP
jgi:hypothetical protein